MTKRLPLTEWKLVPNTCSCDSCQEMCTIPCWPTPQEYQKLIALGYGDRMMLTDRTFVGGGNYVRVISPAKRGREGIDNVETHRNPEYRCVFQDDQGLCELHNICKPIEGRLAVCSNAKGGKQPIDLRDRVLEMWDNPQAQQLVDAWIEKHGRGEQEDWQHYADGMTIYLGDDDDYQCNCQECDPDEAEADLASNSTQGLPGLQR